MKKTISWKNPEAKKVATEKARELKAGAKKLADTYRKWIVANAEYNCILSKDTAIQTTYNINFKTKGKKK